MAMTLNLGKRPEAKKAILNMFVGDANLKIKSLPREMSQIIRVDEFYLNHSEIFQTFCDLIWST